MFIDGDVSKPSANDNIGVAMIAESGWEYLADGSEHEG